MHRPIESFIIGFAFVQISIFVHRATVRGLFHCLCSQKLPLRKQLLFLFLLLLLVFLHFLPHFGSYATTFCFVSIVVGRPNPICRRLSFLPFGFSTHLLLTVFFEVCQSLSLSMFLSFALALIFAAAFGHTSLNTTKRVLVFDADSFAASLILPSSDGLRSFRVHVLLINCFWLLFVSVAEVLCESFPQPQSLTLSSDLRQCSSSLITAYAHSEIMLRCLRRLSQIY